MTIFPEPEGRASKAVLNQQEDAVLTLVRGLVGIRTLEYRGFWLPTDSFSDWQSRQHTGDRCHLANSLHWT